LPGEFGEDAALGVHAGEIGGDCEDFLAGAEYVEGLEQVRPDFFLRHLGCWASCGEKEAHVALILLLGGDGFLGSNLKKNLAGWGAVFGCFAGVLRGFLKNRAFFDGNLLVDLW
jgi:hypothetical protein